VNYLNGNIKDQIAANMKVVHNILNSSIEELGSKTIAGELAFAA